MCRAGGGLLVGQLDRVSFYSNAGLSPALPSHAISASADTPHAPSILHYPHSNLVRAN